MIAVNLGGRCMVEVVVPITDPTLLTTGQLARSITALPETLEGSGPL